MKKTLLSLAILAISGSAFACSGSYCSIPTSSTAIAGVRGSNTVVSGSATTASASGAGSSSSSYAANETRAMTLVGATANATALNANCDTVLGGSVGVSGAVTLSSNSIAYNVSTGNGVGIAAAGGLAAGSVRGGGFYSGNNSIGSIGGAVGGSARASLASGVFATTNTGGVEGAVAGAGFAASASTELTTTGDCNRGRCVTTGDAKVATTGSTSFAYSDKATGNVVGLSNAMSGSLVNANARSFAVAGGHAGVGQVAVDTAWARPD